MDLVEAFYRCCMVVCMSQMSQGYIWTYALNLPSDAAEDAYANDVLHPKNIYPSPNTATRRSDNNTKLTWQACVSDRTCGRGMFCDQHYGTCEQHRKLGQPCRRHGHCTRGLECVFGRCRQAVSLPQPGALCHHDWECGAEQCCAKRHGEKMCQPLVVLDQPCYVPVGGLSYSLNQRCPCSHGLVCRNTASTEEDEQRPWRVIDSLHCAKP